MGQLRTGTMTTRLELGAERPGLRLGFTLVELIVVMAIIGIILAFLLIAAGDARRRAEQDATLALITKLEGGVNDRLDALLQTRPDPNPAHFYMAGHLLPTGSRTARVPQLRSDRPRRGPRSSPGTTTSRASCPTSSSCRTTTGPTIPSTLPSSQRLPRDARSTSGPGQLHVADRQLGRGATDSSCRLRCRQHLEHGWHGHLRRVVLRGRGRLQEPGLPAHRLRRHRQQRQRADRRVG